MWIAFIMDNQLCGNSFRDRLVESYPKDVSLALKIQFRAFMHDFGNLERLLQVDLHSVAFLQGFESNRIRTPQAFGVRKDFNL